jgi:TDG/mug DNA glycosylase family protein
MTRAAARELSGCAAADLFEALARVHAELPAGARLELALPATIGVDALAHALEGGGFALTGKLRAGPRATHVRVERLRTLADRVRPGLRLLICGLNPSLYAADAGVPFARPGNRFWPAARRAGLVAAERDCDAALRAGIDFTDLAKRATRSAAELAPEEYGRGMVRVRALVERIAPAAVCFVGLDGYRRAIEPGAKPGWLDAGLGGRPAYLMPSTSGLNARSGIDALTEHLARAARGCVQGARGAR